MGNNVNTKPSTNNRMFIRWLIFSPTRENEINAKKLKSGKEGYVPNVDKEVGNTYIIENNNVWDRHVKVDSKKVRKIPGATITSKEKIKDCERRRDEKYHQRNSISR